MWTHDLQQFPFCRLIRSWASQCDKGVYLGDSSYRGGGPLILPEGRDRRAPHLYMYNKTCLIICIVYQSVHTLQLAEGGAGLLECTVNCSDVQEAV